MEFQPLRARTAVPAPLPVLKIDDLLERQLHIGNRAAVQSGGAKKISFLQACEQCNEDLVREYISNDLPSNELNAQDRTGKTGLAHACANGFVTIVSYLRLQSIDVNLSDNEGNTPLIFASQAGHTEIVSLLLNYFTGINYDQQNNQGFTALMKAAIQGRARCAKLLLYAGASPYIRDYGKGLCALEWAEYCNRQCCAKTIAQFMEACNLGIICSSLWSKNATGKGNTLSCTKASQLNKWKSDSNLDIDVIDNQSTVSCIPLKLLRRGRRSLTIAEPVQYSAMHSLEEVARCLYSPVFPENLSPQPSPPPTPTKTKVGRRGSTANIRQLTIPKVEITVTSKDDNYYYEHQNLRSVRIVNGHSKFKRYI